MYWHCLVSYLLIFLSAILVQLSFIKFHTCIQSLCFPCVSKPQRSRKYLLYNYSGVDPAIFCKRSIRVMHMEL